MTTGDGPPSDNGESGAGNPKSTRSEPRHAVYQRHTVIVEIVVADGEKPIPPMEASVTDISMKGLGLISTQPIARGLTVSITLFPTTPKEKKLIAKVAWNKLLPSTNRILKAANSSKEFYRIGISLDPKNHLQAEYIKELLSE